MFQAPSPVGQSDRGSVVTVDANEAARYSTRHGVLASICGGEGRTVMQHITAIGFDLFETLVTGGKSAS